MDKIEKIKVEIERRIEECSVQNFIDLEMEYRELLSFIDSLPEELSHSELTKTCPRYDKEAVSEDFEEEVDAFWHDGISQEKDEVEGVLNKTEFKAYARHFANWQREQMIKEAVDATKIFSGIGSNSKTGECVPYTEYSICISDKLCDGRSKIKLIVIKED